MLKSELIKELIDDIVQRGDNEIKVSIIGNSDSLEMNISCCTFYHSTGLNLDCDINYYKNGTRDFYKDIAKIDDFEERLENL